MMVPKTLFCEIALKWGTDKAPQLRTYPVTKDMALPSHCYTPTYWELFGHRRDEIKRVLEIGIYQHGTHFWRECFPNATIYGFDNNPEFLVDEERIKTIYCDVSSEESLLNAITRVGRGLDLIVDDASHVPAHQILAANTLVPFLAPGGYYIIEDVGHPDEVIQGLNYKYELKEFHENEMKNDDDRLIIVRSPYDDN